MPIEKTQNNIALPPEFEPIAYIIYGEDYKTQLENLVRKVPQNFLDSDEWWSELKSVTKVSNEIIKQIRIQYKKLKQEKEQNTGNAFKKLNETPVFKSDPQLQLLIDKLSQQITTNDKNINNLLDLQKKVQNRLEEIDQIIRSREEKSHNTIKESTEKSITESVLSKLITRVRQYLVSDAFKNLIGIEPDGNIINQTTAKLIIRDILQIVAKKAYAKLENKGIHRKDLDKAFKTRTEHASMEIIKQAISILRKKQASSQTNQAPTQNKSAVEILQQEIIQAGLKAKMQGIDPIQAAENKLIELEEKGVDDIAVVRRSWDRHKEKLKSIRP